MKLSESTRKFLGLKPAVDYETDEGRRKMLKALMTAPVTAAVIAQPEVKKEFVRQEFDRGIQQVERTPAYLSSAIAMRSDMFTTMSWRS